MFGANLKKYRLQKGYSQSELADNLYVTRQCVSKWEKGITQPDLDTLSRISELLDVSVDLLLSDGQTAVIADKPKADVGRALFIIHILWTAFCLLAFLALWRFLPQTIPAHFTNGKIDRYGNKAEIFLHLITIAVLLTLDAVIFFATRKSADSISLAVTVARSVIIILQLAGSIFFAALYIEYIENAVSFATCTSAGIMLTLSIAMHPKICRQNQWFGVRTRETLSDKTVWSKTNKLACYLFVGTSLIVFILGVLIESVWICLGFISYVFLAIVIIIYGKRLYVRETELPNKADETVS